MRFSEKYPQLFISAEEELKKQVEGRGLDYDAIKKDTENGIIYEVDFFGILRFGHNFALKITPMKPEFIDYKDIFWAFGDKVGLTQPVDGIVIVFLDGHDVAIELKDKKDEKTILAMIKKSSPGTLIGKTLINRGKYKLFASKMNIIDEQSLKPVTPEPIEKLHQSSVDSMHTKIEDIISLSKNLTDIDKKWYCETSSPLDRSGMKAISKWCKSNGVYPPEPYMILLSHSNGFCVDYSSTVGYFKIYGFDTELTTKERYGRTKEEMLARDYDSYKNCRYGFGWLAHQMLYYNPYTGEMFIEKHRYEYTPIVDFEKEILDNVIAYLEKKKEQYERKDKLLAENVDNPMREMYDELLGYMENDDELNSGIVVYAPLTKNEITDWEKVHGIKLPEDYVNWLLLSDGAEFADKTIYKLEELDTENLAEDPDSGRGYIIIASLSGFSDCLVFDPETTELFAFDDDGEKMEGDFIYHIFEDGFEYLDEMEE